MASTPLLPPLLSFLLLTFLVSSVSSKSILRMLPEDPSRRLTNGGSNKMYCDSWRLSVETNNAGKFKTLPENCVAYVGAYMEGKRYLSDSAVVAHDSLTFAKGLKLAGDGKDAWVFDVDETLLSNAPYYAAHGWGSEPYNETTFDEWVFQGKATALPASLKLYNELLGLGFQLFILTGRDESERNITAQNLKFAGYHSWAELILRGESDIGTSAVAYKSGKRAKLEAKGYRIHGSSGDQWSDLFGSPMAARSFKLPNPMYYIG